MIKFSEENTKTKNLRKISALAQYLTDGRKIYSFDLLAGFTCPGAKDCQSFAVKDSQGKVTIKDGPHTQFRCFSASQEVVFPAVRRMREANTKAIQAEKSIAKIVELLEAALPPKAGIVRLHVSGDMFSLAYLRAWMVVAQNHPNTLFYFYTKSLQYIKVIEKSCKDLSKGIIYDNLLVTASFGGKFDDLISDLNIRTAKVVYAEADTNLDIDHDDSHAATPGGDFALLIHGTQPAGSAASVALYTIRKGLKK